jgi:hypothetical protein
MPQVVDLPPIGQDQRGALASLVRVCKDTPAKGESFREFRSRLRAAKLWDKDRPATILRFLGVGGATITPSVFMQSVAAADSEDDTSHAIMDRVWNLNQLLGKTIIELVAQRAYGKDEIYKYLNGPAYQGVVPSRPGLEAWLQIAIATGVLKQLGIAVVTGARFERYQQLAATIEAEEFLQEDKPEPEPVIPSVDDDTAAASPAAKSFGLDSRVFNREREEAPAPAPTYVSAPESSIPVAAAAPAGSPLPAPLRHLSAEGVPSPRGRERAVPLSRFASGFSDEILEETTKRITAWQDGVKLVSQTYQPSDFGLDPEQWVENADEVLYRIAVAAALAFRLDRDRAGVIAAFAALDKAGVLADLYQGTVPENLPAQVDARALMLASLAARRCAEVPELAASLDGRGSAADVFAALDAALGRGLFRTELFWILDMLARLGVIRYDDLGDYTVTPHRIVRDTLFRLGFVSTPYASDAATLAAAAKAARKAVPIGPADEILTLFALSAACAYDCAHRKTCEFPCRERLD